MTARERLGERLGLPMPVNGSRTEMIEWWAEVGMELAEQQPEFKVPKRRGPKKGSVRINSGDTAEARRSRRYRERRQRLAKYPEAWIKLTAVLTGQKP